MENLPGRPGVPGRVGGGYWRGEGQVDRGAALAGMGRLVGTFIQPERAYVCAE